MPLISLHFELDHDEAHGFHVPAHEITGTVTLDTDAIVLRFDIDGPAPELARIVSIPIAGIAKIRLTGGAVKSPRLVLEVADEEQLREVPWAEGCMCVVRFRRADAVRAQDLVTEVELKMVSRSET